MRNDEEISALIKHEISRHSKATLEEVVFDVLKACYYNCDEGWTMDNEHGSDLSCNVLDAIGPLECEQHIPTDDEEA